MERICLYETEPASLLPLVWFRPIWDLRVGGLTLEERIARLWPGVPLAYAGRALHDALWRSRRGVSVTDPVALGGTLFLDAGLALSEAASSAIRSSRPPFRVQSRGVTVGCLPPLSASASVPGGEELAAALASLLTDAGKSWPALEIDACVVREMPDVIRHAERLLEEDAAFFGDLDPLVRMPPGVTLLGGARVSVGEGAILDPGTTLDARGGPITILPGAKVSFCTWLKGPAAVGSGTELLGGTVGPCVAFGPRCRIRGEVSETFVQGHSNKAHDGFIGHSVLAEWVNLGALTTCSDLKNNYSEVRLEFDGRTVSTGMNKLGVFVADHAKTAIGTLLSTGTVVGVAANVFGGIGLSPKYVPMFSWGVSDERGKKTYDLERCIATARTAMARRSVDLDASYERLMRRIFEQC